MSLQVDLDSLRRETGMYLGYDREQANHTPNQILDMQDVLGKAMRSWYFPIVEGVVYKWSFLQKTGVITTAADQVEYDLPEDFASFTNDCLYFGTDTRKTKVTRRSEGMLLNLFGGAWASGDPLYYAIRTKGTLIQGRAQHELLLYPAPESAVDISFRYMRIPPELSENTPYPLGGELHAETILAACLAAAEQKIEDTAGLHTANFQRLLAGSMAMDSEQA
jgi:hypothetical protein